MNPAQAHDRSPRKKSHTRKLVQSGGAKSRRLRFEPLEERRLLATVTVNTLIDVNNAGDGLTTLREAIVAAAPNDTINFSVTGTIQLTSMAGGHLTVNKNLTIQGPGANLLTVKAFDPDANGNKDSDGFRAFNVSDGSSSSLIDVTISGLTVTGGDPQLDPGAEAQEHTFGGAIRSHENLTVIGCVITNSYTVNGGGIGNGPQVGSSGAFQGTLTVIDSVISGCSANDGGALFTQRGNLVAIRTTMTGNFASNAGGAIFNLNGDLTLTDCSIFGNESINPEKEFSGKGGGVASFYGDTIIEGTTISGNHAAYLGGGIFFNNTGTLVVKNSTISGNSADEKGGGIYIYYYANNDVTIAHSTVTGNSAGTSGGGIENGSSDVTVDLDHTIVAGNTRGTNTRDDLRGSFSARSSLIGDRGTSSNASIDNLGGNQIGTSSMPINALLGPLADNGGPTKTHALLAGSPAIDTGSDTAVAGMGGIPLFDQRGTPFSRVADGDGAGDPAARIDIGAYEKAQSLNLVVDIATDENDFNYSAGDLSLREAVALANANASIANTISFHPSLIGATLLLTMGELTITRGVTINGPGADLLSIDASGNDTTPLANEGNGSCIFNIDDSNAGNFISVEITSLKLTGGDITGNGGAVRNTENLTLTEVAVEANNATGSGGGIWNDQGSLTIANSTLSGNSAGTGGGVWSNTDLATHAFTITNSTLSGNVATAQGGGLFNSDGRTTIRHSTITNNTAPAGQGSGIASTGTVATLSDVHSSLIAGNVNSDVDFVGGASNSFNSGGYNVIGSGNAVSEFVESGDQSGIVNLVLGLLANNGGPTKTHALMLGSKAINAGDPAALAGVGNVPLTDQRGGTSTRVFGGRIDVGAYEFQETVAPLSLVVDIAADEHDGNFNTGDLSLREAIAIANTNSGVVDMISFDALLGGSSIVLTLGELAITDGVTITGLGANLLTIDASGNDSTPLVNEGNGSRIFSIDDATGSLSAVVITNLTLTGGDVAGNGGAIYSLENLTLTNSNITDNSAQDNGGGIFSIGVFAILTINGATISGNSAQFGGGIGQSNGAASVSASTFSGNSAMDGGGIWTDDGNLTISDNTLSGNSATGDGGGLWSDTDLTGTLTTTITNSTISGNSAGGSGGGIQNEEGLVVVRHSTITNNSALVAGSGVNSYGDALIARTEIHSTIIADNTNTDVTFSDGSAENSFQSNGYNLIGTGNAAGEFVEAGDQAGIANPMLGSLADNGGPTFTHTLLTGSPAIDAGDPGAVAGVGDVPLYDQRGNPHSRVLDGRIDIGAVEIEPPIGPALPGDYNLDGVVDAADYIIWRKTLGSSVPQYSGADGNGDTTVDAQDYSVWTGNFGDTLPPGSGGGASSEVASQDSTSSVETMNGDWIDTTPAARAHLKNSPRAHQSTIASASHADLLLALELNGGDGFIADEGDCESQSGVQDRDATLDELFAEYGDDAAVTWRGL